MAKTIQVHPAVYELSELLGQGANGEVFKATRCDSRGHIRQTVAVKILNSKKSVAIWRKEFESLARVNSPFCVRVFGFEWMEERPALILEWIDGITLTELRRYSTLSEDELAYLSDRTTKGLYDLHNHQMSHGDLSPNNILIDRNGDVKLVDFGFGNTQAGRRQVTVEFAAPEVLAGATPTLETDLHSLSKIVHYIYGEHIKRAKPPGPVQIQRGQLGLRVKVRKIQDYRRKNILSTQRSIVAHRWPTVFVKFLLMTGILLGVQSSVSVSAPKNVGEAGVRIRSQYGIEIKWQGRSMGFAPLDILHLEPGTYELEWRGPKRDGRRTLTLKAGDSIVLDDKTF